MTERAETVFSRVVAAVTGGGLVSLLRTRTIVGLVLLLVALVVGIELARPGTVNALWASNMMLFAAPLGIVAAGQTLVMLTGGIDLSVASVATASAYLMATHSGLGVTPAILYGLGVGFVVGLINGIGVALLRVQPLVIWPAAVRYRGQQQGLQSSGHPRLEDTPAQLCHMRPARSRRRPHHCWRHRLCRTQAGRGLPLAVSGRGDHRRNFDLRRPRRIFGHHRRGVDPDRAEQHSYPARRARVGSADPLWRHHPPSRSGLHPPYRLTNPSKDLSCPKNFASSSSALATWA